VAGPDCPPDFHRQLLTELRSPESGSSTTTDGS